MSDESIFGNKDAHQEVIQWACKLLASLGYTLKTNLPEKVQHTPWSYVVRFETTEGCIYLKQTPPLIALEAKIIQTLHEKFHACVATILAFNAKLNCFLMKDAGQSLRVFLKRKFDKALLCQSIETFTSLQIAVSDRVEVLIELGVPDWRLDNFPDLYGDVIVEKDMLRADGLSEKEVSELDAVIPKICILCEKLSSYSIKQTMVQPDFNDNNTLIDEVSKAITIIDLGEIVISHPFFSLLNFLHVIKKHHSLKDDDEAYIAIQSAYLAPYLNFESKENVLEAFSTAQKLWGIYGILAHYRLMRACGKESIMSWQHGKLSSLFRSLYLM